MHLDGGSYSDKATRFIRLTVKGTVHPKITQVWTKLSAEPNPTHRPLVAGCSKTHELLLSVVAYRT